MTLAETCNPMCSANWKARFKAEYWQLLIRYNGLLNMIYKWQHNKLEFTPKCDIGIYEQQLDAMENYLVALKQRAKVEDIDLEKDVRYYYKKPVMIEAYKTDSEMIIPTLEGDMKASVGDYIVTGIHGEQYPCKPDIFEESYYEVTDSEAK